MAIRDIRDYAEEALIEQGAINATIGKIVCDLEEQEDKTTRWVCTDN